LKTVISYTYSMVEKELVLCSITPSYDARTGEYIVQLNFGEVVTNTPEIASRLPQPQPGISLVALKEVPVYTLSLLVRLEEAKRYTVGSKWKLTIEDDGKVVLEAKKDVAG